ncbi:integumentary mucin A.1-like [Anopheles merus]|uniref:Uncharacterized protein n=1 Tax=Anopheles merus TaxID=30066 RepID=A0A182VJ39_ANOME|nr:integumentary mucin A.1-like [Anopheles merus]
MKPVVLSCICLVLLLLGTASFAAPASKKGTESSSESVESNESSSKETTVQGNNAAEVTEEDTNTAQEVMTVPENSVNGTVKLEQPTKPVDQTTTIVAKSSGSTNAAPVPELTKVDEKPETTVVESVEFGSGVVKEDSVKAVAVGAETAPETSVKKVSDVEVSTVAKEDVVTRTLETEEQVRPTQPEVQVTEVTQKVNDLPTVEVTVTLAERESVDLRVETNEPVPVTTETDVVATDSVAADA